MSDEGDTKKARPAGRQNLGRGLAALFGEETVAAATALASTTTLTITTGASAPARPAAVMRTIAATMLEARPEDLAWEKGRWYVKGDPEQGAMIEEIAERAYSGEPMRRLMNGVLGKIATQPRGSQP